MNPLSAYIIYMMVDDRFKLPRVDGKLVRHFRKRAGLSQEQLGNKTALTTTTIGRIERSNSSTPSYSPSHHNVERIAKVLNVPPVNFYTEDDLENFVSGRSLSSIIVDEDNESESSSNSEKLRPEIGKKIQLTPKAFCGHIFTFCFVNKSEWWAVSSTEAEALYLEAGHCIRTQQTIFSADEEVGLFHIFAEGDMATSIVDLAPDIEVEVSARGAYAVYIDPDYWPRDPYHKVFDDRFGFVVEQILSVGPRSTQASLAGQEE